MLESIALDLRHALRSFAKDRTFTATAVLILALGIGATSSIFSVAYGVLLQPLPYPQPEELVRLWPDQPVNKRALVALQDSVPALEGVSGFGTWSIPLTQGGEPDVVEIGRVSVGHFELLGAAASLGHTFRPEHHRADGSGAVAVLSHGLWRQRFGGRHDAIGERLEINGVAHTVIGVMPAEHRPVDPRWQLWTPLIIDPSDAEDLDSSFYLSVIGRLAPGVSQAQAQAQVEAAAWSLVETHGQRFTRDRAESARVVDLHGHIVGSVTSTLVLLLAAVAAVLLVASANVANLLLSRAVYRRREMAVRAALGADRRRLVRQLLVESSVLAALGGAVGWLLSLWTFDLLVAQLPRDLPRLGDLEFGAPVALACGLTAGFAALFFGIAPAVRLATPDLRTPLAGGRRLGGGPRRTTTALVVVQVASSVVLLVTSFLLIESLAALRDTDPGFRSDSVLSLRPSLSPARYSTEQAAAFYDETFDRLLALSAVDRVGAIQLLPMSAENWHFPFLADGQPPDPDAPAGTSLPMANFRAITPGYLETLDIPVLRGRAFTRADRADTRPVGLINRQLAERLWPGQEAVGRRLFLFGDEGRAFTVVGVAGDVRQAGLDTAPQPEIYRPLAQSGEFGIRSMAILLRTQNRPADVADEARAVLRSVDPLLPITDVTTLGTLLDAQVAEPRLTALITSAFALLTLILGMVGIYGVLSRSVAERIPDISLRMALGAARRTVLAEVISTGLKPVAAGLGVGLLLAYAAAQLLRHTLHTAEPGHLGAAAVTVGAVGLAALIALWLPARRASLVDPAKALRQE
ncbi:MAG: ABC transporter permease [Acidobacteriota bacterium]